MGNYSQAKAEVRDYIFAGTPLIIINSSERLRAERLLRETAVELNIRISFYTEAKQVRSLPNGAEKDIGGELIPFVCESFRKNPHTVFAVGDIRRISDDNIFSREVLDALFLAKENDGTLILVTSDSVWQRIAQFGMITTLSLPDSGERTEQIRAFISRFGGRYPIEWDESDIRMAAALLRGFTEIQIENILCAAVVRDQRLTRDGLYGLTGQKSRLYAAVPCVSQVSVDRNLRVSGLSTLKRWLDIRKKIFFAPDAALEERGLSVPKGILLAGVPGCGKSLSAKMIAREWELPLFRFDIGEVYDKWVGGSEKRMRDALEYLDNVSPCTVWIDEIEKALSVSDSGSDTGKRVLGQFLFWLQESKSRVFLVATANDVSALPAELFRKGRFSETFFIDLPNEHERAEAILQYAKRSLLTDISDNFLEELAHVSEGFSYSDIEYAVKSAAQTALIDGQSALTEELVRESFLSVVPISASDPETVGRIREWGYKRAIPASDHNKEIMHI